MKTSKFFFLGLVSLGLFVASCDDDDDDDNDAPPAPAANVIVGNELPVNATGKIDKKQLLKSFNNQKSNNHENK